MGLRKKLEGQKFGRLTVKYLSERKSGRHLIYVCDCDCGTKDIEVFASNLMRGHTLSCGCLKAEINSKVHKKYNEYDLSGEYGIGYLSNNKEFYFDLEDYDKIKEIKWHSRYDGYVYGRIKPQDKSNTALQRFIMNANIDDVVDHKNHNVKDNRKNNLRIVTKAINNINTTPRKKENGLPTGITVSKQNKYVAKIGYNNQTIHLGTFDTLEEAQRARKEAEDKYFGEYSYTNSMKKEK